MYLVFHLKGKNTYPMEKRNFKLKHYRLKTLNLLLIEVALEKLRSSETQSIVDKSIYFREY